MKKSHIVKSIIALLLFILYFFKKKSSMCPFNNQKALENVRPFDLLMGYVQRFQNKWNSAGNTISFDKRSVPTSITYTRDAFIALINAPGAEKVRIYFGLNSAQGPAPDGNLVLSIFPVDANGNDIRAQLVANGSLSAAENAGEEADQPAVMVKAAVAVNAQGVDDGQRKP